MNKKNKNILLILFGLSGVAGLIYEIIWARELVLVFGATVYAISTVLAVFFSGLALGSYFFGKYVDKRGRPLKLYALLELGIGVYAILTPFIFGLIQTLQVSLGNSFGLQEFSEWSLLRFVLSFVALIIPATLMGGTLPVIIKYFTENLSRFGNVTAKLYSINTFGAVIGTTLAGFFLVLWFGVNGTLYFAAVLSLIIGAIALTLSKGERKAASMPEEQRANKYDKKLWLVLGAFFVSGFAAIALEVLWTRALILTIGITTYAFSIILITFLLGIALGSIIISKFIDRINAWNAFAKLEIFRGVSVILLAPLFGVLPLWYLSIIDGLGWSFGAAISASFILTVLALLIPTFLMGMTFPVVAKIVTRDLKHLGFSVGRAYLFNTLGGVAGSLAAGFLLVPLFGVQKSIIFAAFLYLIVGVVLTYFGENKLHKKVILTGFAAVVLIAGIMLPDWNKSLLQSSIFERGPSYFGRDTDDVKAELEKREQLFYEEGISALIGVVENSVQKILLVNGKAQSGSEADKEPQLLLGHLPMLLHQDPKDVLVIGLGSGMTLGAVEKYDELETVTVAEIEPEVIGAAGHFADVTGDALNDPRLNIVVGDGRNYLLTTNETFDIISSEPSNPWIKGMANLYTKEFFELARDHLNDEGLMVQWIQINSTEKEDLNSFIATFQEVFPNTSLWETMTSIILVGSKGDVTSYDSSRINQRLSNESVKEDLARIEIQNSSALLGHFVAASETLEEFTSNVPLHTDDRPFLEFVSAKSFYQSKEKLLENLESLNNIRVPGNAIIASPTPTELEETKMHFDFRTHIILGELAFKRNDFQTASVEFEAAKEIFPELSAPDNKLKVAYSSIASEFEVQGNFEEAERYLQKLVNTFPEEPLAWSDIGIFYSGRGRVEEAKEALLRALELNPEDPLNYINIGEMYSSNGLFQEAEEFYFNAIEQGPNEPTFYKGYARAKVQQGEGEGAIWAYEEFLKLEPDDVTSRIDLGVLYGKKGILDKAEAEFLLALTLEDDNYSAHNNLANVYRLQGRIKEAIKEYETSLDINPDQQEIKPFLSELKAN